MFSEVPRLHGTPFPGFSDLTTERTHGSLTVVSYCLRPWDFWSLEFLRPKIRAPLEAVTPLPFHPIQPQREPIPKIRARLSSTLGPTTARRRAATNPKIYPRPTLDPARTLRGHPPSTRTRSFLINPRCRPYEPNSRLRRFALLASSTPSGKPEGRTSCDLCPL